MAEVARQAFIGVGANLGDRWATIGGARAALARTPGVPAVESSTVYETIPVGVLDQPKFLNLVWGIETTLAPEQLLAVLHALENAAGRRRAREVRWGPRPLDLDLIAFGSETRAISEFALPHPRAHQRRFVLQPLSEIAPDLVLPGQAKAVEQMLRELPSNESVRKLADAA